MRFGIVGLGRMGANIARSARERGHQVVAHDRAATLTAELSAEGFETATTLEELVGRLPAPRIVLVYVPHGRPTELLRHAFGGHPVHHAGEHQAVRS
jgi:6-phosphogluconate dehydrogenase